MGKFTYWNWKKISVFIVFICICNLGFSQTTFKNDNHLLLLIQLKSINGDSLIFSTIEIYMLKNIPKINLTDSLGNRIKGKPNGELFCNRSFTKGILKNGFKKRDIGKLFFVSSTGLPSDISESGCITFLWKEKIKNIDVNQLYPLYRCCDE